MLNGFYTARDYSAKMRRIKFYDEQTGKRLIFLINNFHLTANEIAQLYKHRWKIEIVLQMDKATSKNKIFLRAFRECCKNTNMDSGICICCSSYCKEDINASAITLRNSTDFKHIHF